MPYIITNFLIQSKMKKSKYFLCQNFHRKSWEGNHRHVNLYQKIDWIVADNLLWFSWSRILPLQEENLGPTLEPPITLESKQKLENIVVAIVSEPTDLETGNIFLQSNNLTPTQ